MPSPSEGDGGLQDRLPNDENDSTHSGMWIGHPRLVLASCLRALGDDLYDAYVTESFSSQYDRIADEIISKLSQAGIQIGAKEDLDASPKNQKPD
jgi:hypothetical protein